MKKTALTIVLALVCCFTLLLGVACESSAQKLTTPVVTISESGMASWTAVENATGYAYTLNGGG